MNDQFSLPSLEYEEIVNSVVERVMNYVRTVPQERFDKQGAPEIRELILDLMAQLDPLVQDDISEYQNHYRAVNIRLQQLETAFASLYNEITDQDFAPKVGLQSDIQTQSQEIKEELKKLSKLTSKTIPSKTSEQATKKEAKAPVKGKKSVKNQPKLPKGPKKEI